ESAVDVAEELLVGAGEVVRDGDVEHLVHPGERTSRGGVDTAFGERAELPDLAAQRLVHASVDVIDGQLPGHQGEQRQRREHQQQHPADDAGAGGGKSALSRRRGHAGRRGVCRDGTHQSSSPSSPSSPASSSSMSSRSSTSSSAGGGLTMPSSSSSSPSSPSSPSSSLGAADGDDEDTSPGGVAGVLTVIDFGNGVCGSGSLRRNTAASAIPTTISADTMASGRFTWSSLGRG